MNSRTGYEAWYQKNNSNQCIENPIGFTLEGIDELLHDDTIELSHKAAASKFLKKLNKINNVSNALAGFCAIGAAFSSMAYFLLIRGHSLSLDEQEFLIAPTIVGLLVAGATWYTYRHDTAEWMLDFRWIDVNKIDKKDIAVYTLTFLVVAMEIALSGYGVTELDLGKSETAMLVLACLAALIPEWAQTHKYLDKWIRDTSKNDEVLDQSQERWLIFYKGCSLVTLTFWGMAIFPLIDDYTNAWVAAGAVAFYVLIGKPYMKEKAHEQVRDQFTQTDATTKSGYWYPISRFGNGIGDLAFSAYGFFETLKAFDLMKEHAKPKEVISFSGNAEDTVISCFILLSAVIVVSASCVGSFLMSAGGDQVSYGNMIARAKGNEKEKPPPSTLTFSIWHSKSEAPCPKIIKKTTPTN